MKNCAARRINSLINVHQDDLRVGGEDTDPSVPYMEEFLEFVCEDKNIILKAEDWP